jgi:radical SAM superfamily enzyme YgiQ (UPF0313 family)
LVGLSFVSIGEDEAMWLERPFEEDEVFEVMKALNGYKAPGPGDFTMTFFQTYWDLLKVDIMSVFRFHARGLFTRSFNATFITLNYNFLVPHPSTPFPWSIWRNKVPLKVAFFA